VPSWAPLQLAALDDAVVVQLFRSTVLAALNLLREERL